MRARELYPIGYEQCGICLAEPGRKCINQQRGRFDDCIYYLRRPHSGRCYSRVVQREVFGKSIVKKCAK